MKSALIISGGEYSPLQLEAARGYDYIIACDKGIEYAAKSNIHPNLLIGDMDSCKIEATELFPDVSILTYPMRKDDTDTMLAVKEAISRGYERIHIVCGLGGRLDHTLANIQTLTYCAGHGCLASMASDCENMIILSDKHSSLTIPRQDGKSISLFALSNEVTGVSVSGASYEISDYILTNDYPLGVSNGWKDASVSISIQSGLLLIVNSLFN